MANGAFGQVTLGDTTAGVDCTATNFITELVAEVNTSSTIVHAIDGPGDTMHVRSLILGVSGNAYVSTETGAQTSWGDVTLLGGLDGTVGAQWTVYSDGDYIYVAEATNTIADANWRKVPQSIGGPKRRVVEAGVDRYMHPQDDFVECTVGAINIIIPDGAFEEDEVKTVQDRDGLATANPITVIPESGTINGGANLSLAADYDCVDIKFDGTNYQVV